MTEQEITETSLTVRRVIDAPVERVFEAFTDPDAIAAWYHPGEMTTVVDAWEPEPGGELDITMVAGEDAGLPKDDPGRYRNVGTFREVVENERIVHTWRWVEGEASDESLVTVTFRPADDGTEVVLEHTKLADRESVENHAEGWQGCLENLVGYL